MNHSEIRKVDFFEKQLAKGVLSMDDMNAYKEGKKQLQTDELFIRKKLTGMSGLIEFINENDVQKNCVTNLSKGRVPDEKNIILDKIGIRFGYSATDVDPGLVAYSNAIYGLADLEADGGSSVVTGTVHARAIPVPFQNAEYVLGHDDNIIDAGRIEDLLTQNISTDAVNGAPKNFKELEWPKMLIATKKLTFTIKFADGAVAPAGFFYAELVLKGLGLTKRATN